MAGRLERAILVNLTNKSRISIWWLLATDNEFRETDLETVS